MEKPETVNVFLTSFFTGRTDFRHYRTLRAERNLEHRRLTLDTGVSG